MKVNKYLKIIINISFILILLLPILKSLTGDDYFWHVKVGEWILENKKIPKTGIFSWIAKDKNWFAHEWLSAVLMYLTTLISYKYAPYIYLSIILIILGIIILIVNKQSIYKNPFLFLLWGIFGIITVSIFSTARPHWASLPFLLIFICILEQVKKNNFKHIFYIPIIAILWSNLHGGSSNLLYLLPIGFLITGIRDWKIGKFISTKFNKKQLLVYLSIIIVNILCICINPRGIALLKYPYSYGNMNLNYISEWKPLSSQSACFMIIIGIIILLLIKKEEIELSEAGLICVFILLSFLHLRFTLWTYFISSLYIFKYFDKLEIKNKNLQENINLFFSIYLTLATIIIICSFSLMRNYEVKKVLPDELISLIKRESPQRLYNEYNYGGYLIYNDIDVFLDGRADMYEELDTFKENMNVLGFSLNFKENINNYIQKYNFDYMLIDENSFLNIFLKESKDFYLIYKHENIILYKKR